MATARRVGSSGGSRKTGSGTRGPAKATRSGSSKGPAKKVGASKSPAKKAPAAKSAAKQLVSTKVPPAKKAHPVTKAVAKRAAMPAASAPNAATKRAHRDTLSGAMRIIQRLVASIPATNYASLAASVLELHKAPRATSVAAEEPEQEVGLYLVRPAAASAAQALSSFRVELHRDSREKQLHRLKEFRNDTRSSLGDVERWSEGVRSRGSATVVDGLISAGMVMRLTPQEASELRRDVRGVQVVQNRMLSLIAPTKRSLSGSTAPPYAGWHLDAIGQTVARKDGKAFSGKGVRIAVLDTGIELGHAELGGRVTQAWKIDSSVKAVDHTAVVQDAAHADTDGHGTHVAGLLCGKSVGVAPDAELTSILMMPKGYASTFDFIRCLDWAAEHPEISLINFSAGEFPFNEDMMPFVADLIRTGALPFFAIGNDGENKTCSPGNYIDGVSVGSVNPTDGQSVSSFSGSGKQVWKQTIYEVPDLVAPGAGIWSSYVGGDYAELDGTSMATPVACGVAACLLEKAQGLLSPADLFDQLRRGCSPLAAEPAHRQGSGLVKVP